MGADDRTDNVPDLSVCYNTLIGNKLQKRICKYEKEKTHAGLPARGGFNGMRKRER